MVVVVVAVVVVMVVVLVIAVVVVVVMVFEGDVGGNTGTTLWIMTLFPTFAYYI